MTDGFIIVQNWFERTNFILWIYPGTTFQSLDCWEEEILLRCFDQPILCKNDVFCYILLIFRPLLFDSNDQIEDVAKVRSNLFQFENRVESIICSDKLREVSCVANTCFQEFSWTLSCFVERNAGVVSHLDGFSSGLRPRVPWLARFSLVVTCFHW